MYKIFVSIDAHTTITELAGVLRLDLQLVKDAASAYCRLGFAFKRGTEKPPVGGDWHESWAQGAPKDKGGSLVVDSSADAVSPEPQKEKLLLQDPAAGGRLGKRIAIVFDSTLTAFLMMGNLSPGLKKHAVTMFEVCLVPVYTPRPPARYFDPRNTNSEVGWCGRLFYLCCGYSIA